MGNIIPQKSFDAQMHIIRDVHFDVDKYKVGELYVINQKDPAYLSVQGKTVAQLTEVKEHELKFKTLSLNYDPKTGNSYNTYSIGGLRFTIDDIIERHIEIERLLTETEAVVYLMSTTSKECAKDIIPGQTNEKPVLADKYKGDLSHFTVPNSFAYGEKYFYADGALKRVGMGEEHSSLIKAAYKINTPEEAAEIAKHSQMNIVDDIMKAAEEEKKNYAVWLTSSFSGLSKSFSILDSEGNFDPVPFEGLNTGSGRVWVKFVKGGSTIQFNVHSKYIKVTSDEIIITGNKNKSSICMTLMRGNFREMFDKIEFEQIL